MQNGTYATFDGTQDVRYSAKGTFKRSAPQRPDVKQRIVNAILELEIPDPDANPLKLIRYPVEDGNLVQNIIHTRSKAIRDKV